MRKLIRFAVVSGSLTALMGLGVTAPAGASPPTGYGFDNTAHVIVGGGSDTTYNAMNAITRLWDASLGCATVTADNAAPPAANTCVVPSPNNPETSTLGNYQHDTVVQAFPTGSSTGIGSLNAFPTGVQYAGTVNNSDNVDFARSSREPVTASPFSGTKCNPGGVASNELQCDTFWGFAEDGIEVIGFNSTTAGTVQRGTELAADATGLTDAELFDIWNCTDTVWSQVASLGITPGSAQDGPIVAWGMNSASGTFGTFNTYLVTAGGAPSGFSVDAQTACDHHLTTAASSIFPFENDVKPILNDVFNNGMVATTGSQGSAPAGLSTSATAINNPSNWIWFGSGGVLNSYPYTSSYAIGGSTYTAVAGDVDGTAYSTGSVGTLSYPIVRTLYHVTRKTDADCAVASGAAAFGRPCAFTTNPGPAFAAHNGEPSGTDLNVTGGASGISGAVREFTRFLCRQSAVDYPNDTLTGTNLFTEIQGAVKADGFTAVPTSLKTGGSSCHVES